MGTEAGRWGTWEELILGGAILRHGTEDWNVVASELRARTLDPCAFTPEACKERYKDLQTRYSSSTAWFDELRKQRVAELKRVLAKSEDSIRSLESKIVSLIKGERVHCCPDGYGSNGTQSPNNETSSASFMKDTSATNRRTTSWPSHNHLMTSTPISSHDKSSRAESLPVGPVVVRKKRGQRARRECGGRADEERSVGQSDNLGCNNAVLHSTAEEMMISGGKPGQQAAVGELGGDDELNEVSWDVDMNGLVSIFRRIAETEPAVVFRHRMDSQKRARYRKLIKQHVDMGTIKSRIVERSIKWAEELFRDLLLVANNALVFYSRRTREYKSAVSLRQLVMAEYKKHCCMGSKPHSHEPVSGFITCNPPVRPRTARPRPQPRAPPCKHENSVHGSIEGLEESKKPTGSDFDDNMKLRFSDSCLPKGGLVDGQSKMCVKQRKRVKR